MNWLPITTLCTSGKQPPTNDLYSMEFSFSRLPFGLSPISGIDFVKSVGGSTGFVKRITGYLLLQAPKKDSTRRTGINYSPGSMR